MSWKTLPFLLLLPLSLVLPAERLLGQGTATTPSRSLTDKLKPCRVPDVEEEVLCGRYEVYENRAGTGRKIGLNIVVLPAKTPDVAPDPLVFLAGGGVAPATRYARYFSRAFPDLRLHRDILLVDQRGSGGSNGLECELLTDPTNAEYRDEARFMEAVRRCRKESEKKADLRYYTTPLAMDDLDEVRGWLGYPRLNLFGVSYGTKAAMVYLRQHPERVRAVVMHGVVPLDAPMWLELPRSSQQALDQAFAACAGQLGCRDAFPNLAQEFSTLLQRLAEKPVRVKVSKPETGQEVDAAARRPQLAGGSGGHLRGRIPSRPGDPRLRRVDARLAAQGLLDAGPVQRSCPDHDGSPGSCNPAALWRARGAVPRRFPPSRPAQPGTQRYGSVRLGDGPGLRHRRQLAGSGYELPREDGGFVLRPTRRGAGELRAARFHWALEGKIR